MSSEIVEVSLKQTEVFSIFSSVFSIVLGILAIALSIVFYLMSTKSAKEAEQSSQNIDSNVKKLETLFDKLYSGTFDMMRETVSDMRKHVYPNTNVDSKATMDITKEVEQKTSEIVSKVVDEIKQTEKTDEELERIILNVISRSKQLEKDIKTHTLREAILNYLKFNNGAPYKQVKKFIHSQGLILNENDPSFFREIEALANENIIANPFNYAEEGAVSISTERKIFLNAYN